MRIIIGKKCRKKHRKMIERIRKGKFQTLSHGEKDVNAIPVNNINSLKIPKIQN